MIVVQVQAIDTVVTPVWLIRAACTGGVFVVRLVLFFSGPIVIFVISCIHTTDIGHNLVHFVDLT